MRIFHRTVKTAADAIMSEGFKDNEEKYLSDFSWRGVWVSDRPLRGDPARQNADLPLEVPAEEFAANARSQDRDTHRGRLIPASILNRYGPPRATEDQD